MLRVRRPHLGADIRGGVYDLGESARIEAYVSARVDSTAERIERCTPGQTATLVLQIGQSHERVCTRRGGVEVGSFSGLPFESLQCPEDFNQVIENRFLSDLDVWNNSTAAKILERSPGEVDMLQ